MDIEDKINSLSIGKSLGIQHKTLKDSFMHSGTLLFTKEEEDVFYCQFTFLGSEFYFRYSKTELLNTLKDKLCNPSIPYADWGWMSSGHVFVGIHGMNGAGGTIREKMEYTWLDRWVKEEKDRILNKIYTQV